VCQVFFRLAGNHFWGLFLASQVAVLFSFWCAWTLAKDILDDRLALISVLLLEGVIFFGFFSVEFNHNVALMPFWAGTILFFWRALKSRKTGDWVIAGIFSGSPA